MDFFSLPHQKQPAVTEDEDGATDLFAKAIDERFNNNVLVAPTSTSTSALSNNNRITPLSLLSLSSVPRNTNNHPPTQHLPSRTHSHHLPASSPSASLFNALLPTDLPDILSDSHALILDIRPLPAYLASRFPHAVPLSVPSTLLKRPLFSTLKLAEMLPNRAARRKFSQWRNAKRILVYDADSAILSEGSNILGLLRKFRAEAGLSADPQPSSPSEELQLNWLKGGFQAVFREQQTLLDFNVASDDDDDEDTPSPPAFAASDYLVSSEPFDLTSAASRQTALSIPMANRPALLRTKHLPMSAFTVSSTTSQRSGSAHHKLYLGKQAAARDQISGSAIGGHTSSIRTEFVSRPSGTVTVPQSTSGPGPNVAYNPFYDTIRQNLELSHGITERISLKISRITKDRIDDLPFMWLRELGRLASPDDEGTDAEDNVEGESGSGSGMSGDDQSGMTSDSGEDSGSGKDYADGHRGRGNPMDVAPTTFPTRPSATTPEDVHAEGSETLAMQFYRIELGEQRRLMGVMEHHSRESGRIIEEGEMRSSKSKAKRNKQRSKGTGRSSRGKHGSREFPFSITAGVEKGAKNRYRNIWPFEHARVRLQKQKPKSNQRLNAKLPTSPFSSNSNPGSLHPLTLPQPTDFLPPITLSLSSARSIQLPLNTPAASSSTDDYVNASYVQPLGTKKRYIATQGPLPETFNDFWMLVWEQNVHVIVMLTREVEGSTIKCGNYWSGENFGPLRLKLIEVSGAIDEYEKSDRRAPGGSFFPSVSQTLSATSEPGSGNGSSNGNFPQSTVKRVLELSHVSFSHLPPRRVVQFQYLDWPDLNVPGDTRGVLELIREVERSVEFSEESRGSWEGPRRHDDWRGCAMIGTVRPRGPTLRNSRDVSPNGTRSGSSGSGASSPGFDAIDSDTGIMKHALGERPVLLHCSAGVGRTGGFIAIDAVLDGVRREMRKRREGWRFTGAPWAESQISRSLSGRASAERAGHTSGSSTSEKDRTSSSDEVAAMDVDEASVGERAPPVSGLVMKLPAEDNKAAMHVPVVGMMTPSSSTRPPGRERAPSHATPMEVDAISLATTSPWTTIDSRHKLQTWIPRTRQSEPLSSPSSASAQEHRLPTASVTSAVSQALSRSLSPSGDSALSDISSLSLPLSLRSSFSPAGPGANLTSCTHSSLATAAGTNQRTQTFTAPTVAPLTNATLSTTSSSGSAAVVSPSLLPAAEIAQPVAKRATSSCLPPDTEVASDSSRGLSTGASSLLSDTKSGSPETLPTDPSVVDLSSATKTDLENAGLRLPLPALSGVSTRKSGSKSRESPSGNEDSPPNGSDPYFSQSHSQSEQHSPPAFDYTRPRRLHDDRHSPALLSSLDEPIHRVIEDMREQRMSLCQSLRQYVFVHRAVIDGVLMLVDEERTIYGKTWKDSDLEELSEFVSARFPSDPPVATSESGSVSSAVDRIGSGPTAFVTSGSGKNGSESKSSMEASPSKGKRRASPTELPKEDRRGDMRMSKRLSTKRVLRTSDEYSREDITEASRREEDIVVTPLASR